MLCMLPVELSPPLSEGKEGNYWIASVRSSVHPYDTLQMLLLSNHWADSLQIKFIGTVLACRHAMSWFFAHWAHTGMPIGVIRSLGTYLYGCWDPETTGPIHSKSISLELSWPVDVQCHGHLTISDTVMCTGVIRALVHKARDPSVICLLKVDNARLYNSCHGNFHWIMYIYICLYITYTIYEWNANRIYSKYAGDYIYVLNFFWKLFVHNDKNK